MKHALPVQAGTSKRSPAARRPLEITPAVNSKQVHLLTFKKTRKLFFTFFPAHHYIQENICGQAELELFSTYSLFHLNTVTIKRHLNGFYLKYNCNTSSLPSCSASISRKGKKLTFCFCFLKFLSQIALDFCPKFHKNTFYGQSLQMTVNTVILSVRKISFDLVNMIWMPA